MKRTTIELDERLLARARKALGTTTAKATVEEALRQAARSAEAELTERAERQRTLLRRLSQFADVELLKSDAMWR
jgi:Arc/MetJ family transcription regulator